MNEKLDIYIVTFNRIEMLRKAITAVLSQTYNDFHLYILDNASTIDVESLVKSFNDDRIRYIKHKENIGGLENIKYAFNHCDSDYIIVLHDDDIIDKELINTELKALQEDDDIIAISCNADIINDVDIVIGSYEYNNDEKDLYFVDNYFINYLKTGKTLVFPATMYNNRLLKRYNLSINEKVGPASDIIFHADLERTGKKLAISNRYLIKYRQHSLQDSFINIIPMLISLYKFIVNDQYYSQFIFNDNKLQSHLFNRLAMIIVLRCINNNLDYDQAVIYLNESSNILYYNRFLYIMYRILLVLANSFKIISKALMDVYKKTNK